MKKKYLYLSIIPILLTGCEAKLDFYTHQVLGDYYDGIGYVSPLNTSVSLRVFEKDFFDSSINDFDNIVKGLSKEVDRYNNYNNINNLKVINDSCGSNEEIQVSNELYELIELGINLTKITEGKFHLAMGSLIDLYEDKFNDENVGTINTLPSQDSIETVINSIPPYSDVEKYIILNEQNKTVKLNKYNDSNVIISLGAIAKGFVMQKAYDYLLTYNKPFLFDAGSSTVAMAYDNPTRKNKLWNVGFINPVNINQELLCSISSSGNTFISTSGDFQKYFYYIEDGTQKLMHHILDVNSGFSNSYYRCVSVVSNDASLAVLDATSTALFNCETIEDSISLINDIEEIYDCSISYCLTSQLDGEDLKIVVSSEFDKMITSYASNVKAKQVKD